LKNFPASSVKYPSDCSDWEILSVLKYLNLAYHRVTSQGQKEYDKLLSDFNGDKQSLDAWLYKLTKLFEYEFDTRHAN
jgi:hypothetical protein